MLTGATCSRTRRSKAATYRLRPTSGPVGCFTYTCHLSEGISLTRLLFRSPLMALCLTAVTARTARADNWFSGWGRKKAAADIEDAEPAEAVADEKAAENSDAISDEDPGEEAKHKHRFQVQGDEFVAEANAGRLRAIDRINE